MGRKCSGQRGRFMELAAYRQEADSPVPPLETEAKGASRGSAGPRSSALTKVRSDRVRNCATAQ